jgi:hypothetical protein
MALCIASGPSRNSRSVVHRLSDGTWIDDSAGAKSAR